MDRFWLKSYPKGVPADIDYHQYESLVQLLEEAFRKHSSQPAYGFMGKDLTYHQLDEFSSALAAWLQSKGFSKGKRVAIMMPNVMQYPVALAAVLRAGCTVVNVNPLYTPRELEHQLKDSGAEAIFIVENFAHTLQQVYDEGAHKNGRGVCDGRHARLRQGAAGQLRRSQREEDGAGVHYSECRALERGARGWPAHDAQAGQRRP